MKAGKTLEELAAELESQQARKQDWVVDTRELRVLTSSGGTEVVLPGKPELTPSKHMLRQLGTHVGVRADLADRLRDRYPAQFDGLVNGILSNEATAENKGQPVLRMIRTYRDDGNGGQGIARALLSNSYRRIDNHDLASVILPVIGKIPGVQIPVCELTETRMYIKVLVPGLQVNLNDLIQPGVHTFLPDTPDYVQAGFVVTNSEVGASALSIEQMLFRLVCTNGLIVGKMLRRNHVGSKVTADEDLSIYRSETLAADDKALMMKVEDAIRAAVNETQFRAIATQFAETKDTLPVQHPIPAMQELAQKITLTDGERDSVLTHLLKGGDLTKFGVVNAVTRAAHDVESYDRSIELEQAGAQVMNFSMADWGRLVAA